MKFYKYIIYCIISWFLIISLYSLYIKLMQRKKNRSLEAFFFCYISKDYDRLRFFFRYKSCN